jgi:hypothetical protein
MKRILSILIAAAAVITAAVPAAYAKPYSDYPWVYEDFEEDAPINAAASNASISRFKGGAGGTEGAARISVNKDYGTAKFPLRLKKGTTYNVSVWIKMIGDIPKNNNLHFIFYMHQKLSDGSPAENASCFKDISVGNIEYSTEEYVRVATTFKYEGVGRLNGADVETCDGDATVELRVGNGTLATTNGSVIDYLIDDFIVEPVMKDEQAVQTDTSIGFKNGNFETGYDNSVWRSQNCNVSVIPGANGTKNGIMITSTGNYGQIKQRAPMQFNKAYRISMYAKAGDDATVGKDIKLIIDRQDGRTDSIVTPNYEYLPSAALKSTPPSLVLTDEWQRIEFIYKNSMATFEKNEPYIYPRVGSGTANECYCLDEMEVEEIPGILYNGDFSEGMLAWKTDGTSAQTSADVPAAAVSDKSVKITEKSNYGVFSQGINVQPEHTYRISFSAKGESWTNAAAEQIELYPVMDRYASNSTDEVIYENLTLADGSAAMLTKQWQDYEFEYKCEYSGSEYRVPIFYLQTGDGKQKTTYYLHNVKIEDITENTGEGGEEQESGTISDIAVDGKTIEGQELTLTYNLTDVEDIDGIIKIMKSYGKDYVSVGSAKLDGSPIRYTVKGGDVGSSLRFTAVLVNDENPISVKSIVTDELAYSLNIKPQFTSDMTASEITAMVEIRNSDADINITAALALFDENNTMISMTEKSVNSKVESADIMRLSVDNNSAAKKARLYVWEGTSAVDTTMNSLIENISME